MPNPIPPPLLRRLACLPAALLLCFLSPVSAIAAVCDSNNGVTTCPVDSEAGLAAAIAEINALPGGGVSVIDFTDSVSLISALPDITSGDMVFIKGNGETLSGGAGSLLHVGDTSGSHTFVQISDLTLDGGQATAPALGGGLYVDSSANVVLKNVKVQGNQAVEGGAGNALGGGIYVAPGGGLNLGGNAVVSGNGTGSGTGVAAGDGLFLGGTGMLTLHANKGETLAINDAIGDGTGAGLAGVWSLYLQGGGGVPVDNTNPLAGADYGLITLGGNNTYSGGTFISGVNVGVNGMGALGSSGAVTLDDGGLVVANGVTIDRDFNLLSDSRVGVASGQATLANNVTGTDMLIKVGLGDLELQMQPTSNFKGDWLVYQGGLLLDDDSRLGSSKLTLSGGGVGFLGDFALRSLLVTTEGGYVDNRGHQASISSGALGPVQGWISDVNLTFRDSSGTGNGVTTLAEGSVAATGNTRVESGTVKGNIARGSLTVDTGAGYDLGGADRQISALEGNGKVLLGTNTLKISLGSPLGSLSGSGPASAAFSGVISGAGGLTVESQTLLPLFWSPSSLPDVESFDRQTLTGNNTYTGGTLVRSSGLLEVNSEAALGSGDVTLQNGALEFTGSTLGRNIHTAGSVGILATTGNVDFLGALSGAADFLKTGTGTLALHTDNSTGFTGRLVVAGDGSRVSVDAANQLGGNNLVLTQGGGLLLRADVSGLNQIQVADGTGIIDTANHTGRSTQQISGAGQLVKAGTGNLILTGKLALDGGIDIQGGSLQLGEGATGSSVDAAINIGTGALLQVNRSDDLVLAQTISGDGELVKAGAGLLTLGTDNSFAGGLTVNAGLVRGASDAAYGAGTILLDGGGLRLVSDLSRDVVLGPADGNLDVDTGDSWHFSGLLGGTGALHKTGTGTLVYTGIGDAGLTLDVDAGLFQVGEGMTGALAGNVSVASGAGLAFARDDLTLYPGVVSGAGDVFKRGAGELVLTGDQLFTGDLRVETGSVRLGYGGTSGSLAGGADLATGTELLVDRSGFATISGSLSGDGSLRQIGTSQLILTGDSSAFAGTASVENGSLRLDGTLGGDLSLFYGTWLQGNGTLLGDLYLPAGAELRPGNSIGTFHVAGNLLMDPGSQLTIELDDAGHFDKVEVGGSATLGGTLHLAPQAGTWAPGCCTYTILEAAGGLGGSQFDLVSNDLAFLTSRVDYFADHVNVTLALTGGGGIFGSLNGLTWNQQQVAGALDALAGQDPTQPLVQQMIPLTAAQARSAYDSLAGDVYLNQAQVAQMAQRRFGGLLTQRASRLGLASRKETEAEQGLARARLGLLPGQWQGLAGSGAVAPVEGVWVEVSPLQQEQDADNKIGSAGSRLAGNLLSLGADGYWTDNLLVGFGLGYLQGSLKYDNRVASGDLTGTFAGIYLRHEDASGWQLKGALSLGRQSVDFTRSVTVGGTTQAVRSTADTNLLGLDVELGRAWQSGNFGVRPYVAASWQQLGRAAIRERGAGVVALDVDKTDDRPGEFGLGVELSRPWLMRSARWAQFKGGLALFQPFGDTRLAQQASFVGTTPVYTVKSTDNKGPVLQLDLGGEWYLGSKLALWAGYEGRAGQTVREHNGIVSLQYRW